MSPRETIALRDYLGPDLKDRSISDARQLVSLTNILGQTCLGSRLGDLSGRSVLLAVEDQLLSAIAMTEIDGVARRMLLCPPDFNADHIQTLIEDADIDAVVTDHPPRWTDSEVYLVVAARPPAPATGKKVKTGRATEWLMLTSGTSDAPKIVGHTLEGLTGAIVADGPASGAPPVWATFHDIRRYGGRHPQWRFDGAVGAQRADRRLCRAAECERRHSHLGHAVALAQTPDERVGLRLFSTLRSFVERDRRSGRIGWLGAGLSRGFDRACLCIDRSRRRLCRERWP